MVWIDGSTCSIILDLNEGHITDTTPSESMIVTVVNKCKYVDFDNRYIYFTKNGEISRFPLLAFNCQLFITPFNTPIILS